MTGVRHETCVVGYEIGDMRRLEGFCIPKERRHEDVVFVEDMLGNPYALMGHVARIDYGDAKSAARRRVYLMHRCVDRGIPYAPVQRGCSVWLLPIAEGNSKQ